MALEKHMTYFNILDSFKEAGCPVCFLVNKAVVNFFDSFLFEHVLDDELNIKLTKSKGFCKEHAHKLIQFGDALATAITYQPLIEELMQELEKGKLKNKLFFKKEGECPGCGIKNEAEDRYAGAFAVYIKEEEFLEKLKNSSGLCLPHFRKILDKAKDKKAVNSLIETQKVFLKEINLELKELMRKNDYRYRTEKWGSEKDSWIRAVKKIIGEKE